ncbi:tRNA(Met) cytidine acetyltransferase [Pseudoalteromonas sp. BSi20311]|uniref:GNAT family N-acetyltransferase n=1 Tax=Pseudoalteromonas sp. BSi20311 TaxID=383911 RepID=UPI00023170F2|nr:GNAT family N-acetyltransferase [Pseudoalteromonas sp. BSi20311]GAA62258.1 tRNA(Met) cytidine acetyltransferase [Pseudoalteromonas sp. BSi20311]HCP97483.1 tRNA(Met) cytidine acetyltransferase [Pseudoalteromonas sp.]
MQDYKPFNRVIEHLQQQLTNAKHRQLLLLTGDKNWCYEQCTQLLAQLQQPSFVLSKNTNLVNAHWPEHTHQILGQECAHAVYDGYSGLVPDKLAALAGVVQAGGFLIVLLPALESLEHWCDPALPLFQSFGQAHQYSFFNQRLKHLLSNASLLHFNQQDGWVTLADIDSSVGTIDFTEQQQCVELIKKTAHGRANRPLLINADRGRGKSAALGIAASELSDKKILISSMQFRALHSSFKHLANALNLEYQTGNKCIANMHYVAPDQLLNEQPECDLLLIDEAAAIPVPMLIKLLHLYPRVVFSSTMVGYEGNGRGYILKFTRYIKTHFKNMRSISLEQPIRFAKHDPLELHLRTLLALDAEHHSASLNTAPLQFKHLQANQLTNDEPLLHQVVGLLTLAHYQTSVNDLRHLLDAAGQRLFVCQQGDNILGVCLVAIEGGFTTSLSNEVVQGKRRPQGHLMAQSLAQLSFNPELLKQYCARVVRIAIDPEQHNKHLGTQLLHYCEQQLQNECDWFGASFGANAQLLSFWQNNDFNLVKLGFQKDKATGEHSALVIKRLTKNDQLLEQLTAQFEADFPLQLLSHFSQLDYKLVAKIVSRFNTHTNSIADQSRLKSMLTSDYQLFNIKPLLWRSFWASPLSLPNDEDNFQSVFIRLVLQNWKPKNIQTELGVNGIKPFNILLKKAVNNWYERTSHNNTP